MTTAVKEKKPFLPQRKVQAPAAGGTVAVRPGAIARPAAAAGPIIGGEPRVHLLPQEVVERKGLRQVKRRLITVGIVVLAVVALAYGGATLELSTAQQALTTAQGTTTQLLAQQAKYGQVTKVQADSAAIIAAQKSTTTQEILWQKFMTEVESTLPSGAAITAANASMDSPIGAAAGTTPTVSTNPLQQPHIATVVLTVSIAQGQVPGWLNSLPTTVTGFVDATPGSVTAPSQGGTNYQLVVTIHLDAKAVSGRFVTPAPSASSTTGGTN